MSYVTPNPPIQSLPEPHQTIIRRLLERVENLETVTNVQGFSSGRKAPAPPQAQLAVTSQAGSPGVAFVKITNPQYLTSGRNKMRAPIQHWLQASPFPNFSANVQDFGISNQTHWSAPVGSGKLYFRLYSTFDGVTFNNPIQQKVVIS